MESSAYITYTFWEGGRAYSFRGLAALAMLLGAMVFFVRISLEKPDRDIFIFLWGAFLWFMIFAALLGKMLFDAKKRVWRVWIDLEKGGVRIMGVMGKIYEWNIRDFHAVSSYAEPKGGPISVWLRGETTVAEIARFSHSGPLMDKKKDYGDAAALPTSPRSQ